MIVRDLMSEDVVTVDTDGTLADAGAALLEHGVGSVIIVDENETPVGILTESDIIRAGYESGEPFDTIDVMAVGHRPVITTEATASISLVADRMEREGVKKVPVMDGMDLVGIITFTDIVFHLSDIRQEATDLAGARERWEE